MEINILKPIFEGSIYDYIIEINKEFKRIQVKSSESNDSNKTEFDTTKGVSYKNGNRLNGRYNIEDFDYFYLYSEFKNEGYIVENKGQRSVTIRHVPPKNNQLNKVNMGENFLFKKFVKGLL